MTHRAEWVEAVVSSTETKATKSNKNGDAKMCTQPIRHGNVQSDLLQYSKDSYYFVDCITCLHAFLCVSYR